MGARRHLLIDSIEHSRTYHSFSPRHQECADPSFLPYGFPSGHYFVYFDYRYRYPIMWVTFLLGAVPIAMYARGPGAAWRRYGPYQRLEMRSAAG